MQHWIWSVKSISEQLTASHNDTEILSICCEQGNVSQRIQVPTAMTLKPLNEPFNKADAQLRSPPTHFEKFSIEAKDILGPDIPVLDTELDEVVPGNIAENDCYRP